MLTLEQPNQVSLKPEDFDPPLKRNKATIPDYWTVEELAKELDISPRKINYDINGRPSIGQEPSLKAYKVSRIMLIRDDDAFEYIRRFRSQKHRKKS